MVLLMGVSIYLQKLLVVVCQFVKCQRLNLLMVLLMGVCKYLQNLLMVV